MNTLQVGRVGGKVSDEVTPKVNFAPNWGCQYDAPPICGLQCVLEMGEKSGCSGDGGG